MITEVLTQHALIRMAQHGIKIEDAELIMMIGTEVEDGQFVRTKDCQTFEHAVKQLIERVWRLNGKRVVRRDCIPYIPGQRASVATPC
jgi:hypothetical protein